MLSRPARSLGAGERGLLAPALLVARPALHGGAGIVPPTSRGTALIVGASSSESTLMTVPPSATGRASSSRP